MMIHWRPVPVARHSAERSSLRTLVAGLKRKGAVSEGQTETMAISVVERQKKDGIHIWRTSRSRQCCETGWYPQSSDAAHESEGIFLGAGRRVRVGKNAAVRLQGMEPWHGLLSPDLYSLTLSSCVSACCARR